MDATNINKNRMGSEIGSRIAKGTEQNGAQKNQRKSDAKRTADLIADRPMQTEAVLGRAGGKGKSRSKGCFLFGPNMSDAAWS